MTAISLSTDPESRDNYGPYIANLGSVCPATGQRLPYDSLPELETAFKAHAPKIAALLVEPIQGEAGIVVPSPDYLPAIRKLCSEHNILLILDEIQTGIARTGRMLCHEHADIKPDLCLLGKALSGGMYPVSCVLGSRSVLGVLEPGTHGSTYGGNPLGCAVAMRALEVVREEGLVERAARLGEVFRRGMEEIKARTGIVTVVRGMGLLNAIVVDERRLGASAWELCVLLKEKGLLVGRALKVAHVRGGEDGGGGGSGSGGGGGIGGEAQAEATEAPAPPVGAGAEAAGASPPTQKKAGGEEDAAGGGGGAEEEEGGTSTVRNPSANRSVSLQQAKPTHVNIIRLAPPLVISEAQVQRAVEIVGEAIKEMARMRRAQVEQVVPEGQRGEGLRVEN